MTLVRPNLRVEPSVSAEMSMDQAQTILSELRGLRQELLGSIDGETKHGRLPRLEADTSELERRVKSLEDDRIRWKSYAVAAAAIGGVMGACAAAVLQALVSIVHR